MVWRSATTLIEANALPLSQTANQVTACNIQDYTTVIVACMTHIEYTNKESQEP